MTPSVAGQVTHLDLSELHDEYHRRKLDELSDVELVAAVGCVLSEPREDPADSFVLHAPLELAARTALLSRVTPGRRELARLHIVAIAAQYEASGPAIATAGPRSTITNPDDAIRAFQDAVSEGDLERTDVAAQAVAALLGPREMVDALADFIAPLTGAAAHAPIFFNQLLRGDPRSGLTTSLLRPLARDLARRPTWRIAWIDEWSAERPTDATSLHDVLASTPRIDFDGPSFIHPIIQNVDASGAAAQLLGNVVGRPDADAAHAILRVAAQSMLQDTSEHAPYGWTHCLTLPQAVLGSAAFSADPARAQAIAATQVMAFRAALGESSLDPTAWIDESNVDVTQLVTRAATRHDAHVVKYTLACLDAATDDPGHADLYLAAAQRLHDVWDDRGGDPTDPLPGL